MILRTCSIREFIERCRSKEVVCYGAGNWLSILSDEFKIDIEKVYSYAVDSNKSLWGTVRRAGTRMIEVRSPNYLFDHVHENTVVLITSGEHYAEIYERLEKISKLKDSDCYIVTFLQRKEEERACYDVPPAPKGFRMNKKPVIPKVIHYMWFSGEPLPDWAIRCMESWKKYAPDFELKEWNIQNYNYTSHPYVFEAIKRKKWGFAGDYARLDVIYKYGGFYFDLDVELLRNIDDLRYNSAFFGFESLDTINIGSGFGAVPNHPVIRYLRDAYDNIRFIDESGDMNLEPSPSYQTQSFMKMGGVINGQFQILQDCAIYPAIYFTPKNWKTGNLYKSDESYSIHHFVGSWVEKKDDAVDNKNDLYKLATQNEKGVYEYYSL